MRARLREWQAWYDRQEPDRPEVDRTWLHDFAEEGRRIARAIKAELPEWTVVCFDEEAAHGRPPDAPPGTFEYEIM